MSQDQEGKHDQSQIKNDGWTKDELEKDQSGNDKQIEILEKAVEATPPPPPTKGQ